MGESQDSLSNRIITVSGKVELYKDKPQIVISKPGQISSAIAVMPKKQ